MENLAKKFKLVTKPTRFRVEIRALNSPPKKKIIFLGAAVALAVRQSEKIRLNV